MRRYDDGTIQQEMASLVLRAHGMRRWQSRSVRMCVNVAPLSGPDAASHADGVPKMRALSVLELDTEALCIADVTVSIGIAQTITFC